MQSVTHLFFDVDDTIFDFDKCAADSIAKAFDKFGLKYDDSVFCAFKRINSDFWRRIEKGEIDRAYLARHRFDALFKEIGVDFPGPVFETEFRANLHSSCIEVEGAAEVIRALHGRYKLFVASNSFYAQQHNRLALAGIADCFDAIYASEDIGASKPSPEFFKKIMRLAQVDDARRAMMIGDSLTADIVGAASVGMRSCWIKKCSPDKIPDYVDLHIDDIRLLPDLLKTL